MDSVVLAVSIYDPMDKSYDATIAQKDQFLLVRVKIDETTKKFVLHNLSKLTVREYLNIIQDPDVKAEVLSRQELGEMLALHFPIGAPGYIKHDSSSERV